MPGIGSHTLPNEGKTNCWLTPPAVIEALGPFDLDPCAAPGWPTAERHYQLPDDGLALPWFGRVWLNPPYGRDTGKWLERLGQHGNGIALVLARTETKTFFDHVWGKVAGALFLKGRLHFHNEDGARATGNAGGPSVLLAYGEENADRLRVCGLDGAFVQEKPRGRDSANKFFVPT